MREQQHKTAPADCAFETPVMLYRSGEGVRTVAEATHIVRQRLQTQFTVATLNTLLMLERAADGSEIAEAREAFATWANSERLT